LAFLIFAIVVLLAGLRELPVSLIIYSLLLIVPPALYGTPDIRLFGLKHGLADFCMVAVRLQRA
jgi:hypothetical protein